MISEIANPELKLAFDFVEFTDKNVFLTGKAGTGKTTFLHNLKNHSPKRMIVCAPTGVAAINAGGVTIHSFFQLSFGPQIPNAIKDKSESNHFQRFSKDKINIIRTLDLLVIDEISMVRSDLLDGIDEVLRRFKNKHKPFGGVQLLMIGDLQQLSPVIKDEEWGILKPYYETIYFFSSRALKQTQFVSIELKHIYRQSDKVFIDILNKVRENKIDTPTLIELNKRHFPNFEHSDSDGYITLTTHNYQAQNLNQSKLSKINKPSQKYIAKVTGEFPEYSYPTDFELEMKVGAQVMFVKNDTSPEKLFYNGKIGKITDITENSIFVSCDGSDEDICVEPLVWENTKYTIDPDTKEIKETVSGTFTQYPLKLAWAITIHKSQGLTFEKAIIDAKAAFAHGQVYVALSRCKTLEGLVLNTPIMQQSIISDTTVIGFTQDIEDNPPTAQQLIASKYAFQQSILNDLFNFDPIQHRINYCLKIINEHTASIHLSYRDTFERINNSYKNDIANVAWKMSNLMLNLYLTEPDVEKNEQLQERVRSGSAYFFEKLNSTILMVLNNTTLEIDNKAVRKTIIEAVDRLNEDTKLRAICLQSCTSGFNVKRFLEVRAKGAIETPETKVTFKNPAIDYLSSPHPKLYSILKEWRVGKAQEWDTDAYMIIQNKTLLDLVSYLPTTTNELKKIKGFGEKKVKQFGREILEIISMYMRETNMELPSQNNSIHKDIYFESEPIQKKEQKTPKAEKIDTKKATYDLYLSGKSIFEISVLRGMATMTIEGHLAHYVGTGELEVGKFVTPEKLEMIIAYFNSVQTTNLTPAKEALGDDYSYGELKIALKHMEFLVKKQNINS